MRHFRVKHNFAQENAPLESVSANNGILAGNVHNATARHWQSLCLGRGESKFFHNGFFDDGMGSPATNFAFNSRIFVVAVAICTNPSHS